MLSVHVFVLPTGRVSVNAADLTADSHAIILLRSALAMPPDGSIPLPLEYGEWSRLAAALKASPLRRPGALLGRSAATIAQALDFAIPDAERFAALLARHADLGIELDRLASLGIRALTRVEPDYPVRLKERLGTRAPAVLFVAGNLEGLSGRTLAVTGSRDLDHAGTGFARGLGERCAAAGVAVVSGGARGADREAMNAALAANGSSVGVLADGLERQAAARETGEWLHSGNLALLSPSLPSAAFDAALAHARNRLIYCLGDLAVVVSSDAGKGGTWSGATEALREGWTPLFVRDEPDTPPGNAALLRRGALALDPARLAGEDDIHTYLLGQALASSANDDGGLGNGTADEPGHGTESSASPETHKSKSDPGQPPKAARAARTLRKAGPAGATDRGDSSMPHGDSPGKSDDLTDQPSPCASDGLVTAHGIPSSPEPDRDIACDEGEVADGEPVDLFTIVWPRIAAYLQRAHPVRDVAEAFCLEPAQAQRWLRRAAGEGLAELAGKTSGYRAVTPERPASVQAPLL